MLHGSVLKWGNITKQSTPLPLPSIQRWGVCCFLQVARTAALTIVKTGVTIVSYFGNVTASLFALTIVRKFTPRWSKTVRTNYSYTKQGLWVLKFINKPFRLIGLIWSDWLATNQNVTLLFARARRAYINMQKKNQAWSEGETNKKQTKNLHRLIRTSCC